MRRFVNSVFAATIFWALESSAVPFAKAQDYHDRGLVTVSDKQLMRDGKPSTPHGFFQIAFAVSLVYFTGTPTSTPE